MTGSNKPFDKKTLHERLDVNFALRAAGLGVWEVDPTTNLVIWDDQCREMFGLAKDNLLPYEQAIQYIHPEDVEGVKKAVAWAMNSESGGDYDLTYRTIGADDGLLRWVRFSGQGYFNEAGQVIRLAGIAQDVTLQMAADQNQPHLLASFEQSPVGIAMITDNQKLIFQMANPLYSALAGRNPQELVGKPLLKAIPELAGQGFDELLKRVMRTGEPFMAQEARAEIRRGDQFDFMYVDYHVQPQRNSIGTITGVLIVTIDVTNQVLARQKVAESEAHLQLLRDTVPAMIFYLDAEQRYQSYNGVFMDWFKVNATEAIGKTVREFLDEQAYKSVRPYLDKAYGGQQTRYELHAPSRMNTDRWLSIVYTPHLAEDGKVIGVIVLSTDITQQVLARQKAQESEESLRGAIELAAMGTWEWSMSTGIITYSESLKRLFEFNQDFIEGDVVYNPILEQDRAHVEAAMGRATTPEFGGLLDEEYGIITQQTGRHRIVRAQGKMYFDASGQPRKMLGSMRDVTEERELQLALEQLVQQRTEELAAANKELASTNEELEANNEEYAAINEALEEANRLLSRSNANLQTFAYVASHDLQEPLRKIQQFGDLLKTRQASLSGDEVVYIERMQSAASRMSTLIRDLLNFSRIATQRDTNSSVALNAIVEQVLITLEMVIAETNAEIRVEPLPTIQGDDSQLTQLFQNLIGNALKFRRPSVAPLIQLTAQILEADELPPSVKPTRVAKAYYRIDVADNGVGFDEKYVDRIFQVFQRLHGKNEFAGTGIGLAICERVAVNHGGAITAHSQPGQGATFRVYLPA
ncbi:PAS domain-containing sensor histidine kinase [Spirosoma endophyticum]|uniref:histidine kinase n=1 Tax=Spirosoma endophyticum TaxID=662367 RepID=A0A1I2GVE8_9BACT|nr:PAS domain-containing protein [Spirosoma endophyticum]SFF21655.1 PAS domain S-box-containing protein [Spirosoma endophyticum]